MDGVERLNGSRKWAARFVESPFGDGHELDERFDIGDPSVQLQEVGCRYRALQGEPFDGPADLCPRQARRHRAQPAAPLGKCAGLVEENSEDDA